MYICMPLYCVSVIARVSSNSTKYRNLHYGLISTIYCRQLSGPQPFRVYYRLLSPFIVGRNVKILKRSCSYFVNLN